MPSGRNRRSGSGSSPPVIYEKAGWIAVVSLNRPEVLNAYNAAMRDALYEALLAAGDDPEVRVLVLRGRGRAFCSGGDLREFGTAPSPVEARRARWGRDVWGVLRALPQATIAAVHGYAVGGGWEMAMLCDLCIASDDARFAFPETSLGMIPGVGGTQTAPRLAGSGRALDFVLTGRWLTAEEALQIGVVARVVPRARLWKETRAAAEAIAHIEPALLRASKRAVWDGWDLPLAEGLALERRLGRGAPLARAGRWNRNRLTPM